MIKKIFVINLIFWFQNLIPNLWAQSWTELGFDSSGINANDQILTLSTDKSGNVFAAGKFTNGSNRTGYNYVAKWNGNKWEELGTGLNALNANDSIISIATDNKGNVYAAGAFSNDSGYRYVAKWNGVTWKELGGLNALKANNLILTICVDKAGNLYAGGRFLNDSGLKYVAMWNGTNWSELGGLNTLGNPFVINQIISDDTGNIYVAHDSWIKKWNNVSWEQIGHFNGFVRALTIDKSGHLFAGGDFYNTKNQQYVAIWDGKNIFKWKQHTAGIDSPNSNVIIWAITSDGGGNIYAAGYYIVDSKGSACVLKWDGSKWSEFGKINSYFLTKVIWTILFDNNGNLYAAGGLGDSNLTFCVMRYGFPLGIKVQNINTTFSIYPNPTSSSFIIQYSGVVGQESMHRQQLTIYNMLGQQVYNDIWQASQTQCCIDVSMLPKGLYIVKIGGEMKKIIIQ